MSYPIGNHPMPQTRAAATAGQPTVGLIGTGWVARHHLHAWNALDVKTTVLARRGNGAALVREFGPGATLATSFDELTDQVDIVDICTPTDTHVDLAAAAIAAGRHVICEKPLATDAASASRLAALAASAGVCLLPAHVVRYVPAYEALHQAVQSGRLGTVVSARFTRTTAAPTWSPWFWDESRSGGIIFDQMIHDLDQAARIVGFVVKVYARCTPATRGRRTASATVILSHDSGALTQVIGLWGPADTTFRTTYHITGTLGTVDHDSDRASPLRIRAAESGIGDELGYFSDGSPFVDQLREFLQSITGQASARVTPADGVAAVALAEAALRSARAGKPVHVSSGHTVGDSR